MFWVAITAVVMILAVWKIHKVTRSQIDLFAVWLSLGQPLRRFPTNAIMHAKLIMWAESKVLRPLATDVTKAFEARDNARKKASFAYGTLCEVRDNPDQCASPRDLTAYKRAVEKARSAIGCAERKGKIASDRANRLQKRYLAVWDFLTKPEPNGIGILIGENYRDPDVFRHRVSEKKADVPPPAVA
jgi:hypothetical protein